MATPELEELDKILAEIEPEYVPSEFISAACVTDLDGEVYIITREELEDITDCELSLEDQGIDEIGLILNLEEVKETIRHYVEIILKDTTL